MATVAAHLARLPRGRRSLYCVGAITLTGQVGLAATPLLVDSAPLLLLALRARTEMILLLSGSMSATAILLVAIPLRMFFHLSYFELGRWGGDRVVGRFRSGRWLLAKARNPVFTSTALYSCLIFQSSRTDMLLGAQNVPRRKAYPVLMVGVAAWTFVLVYASKALNIDTSAVIHLITDHRALFAIAAIGTAVMVAVIHLGIFRKWSRLPKRPDVQER